ncbi:unnamed protein product [Rotaria sp. Silwood2]|nr:unnamed protein product [Rotaria sp. Silwood2]CAF4244326.1 unnamed protein product [Rotaria sp. Silwood2]
MSLYTNNNHSSCFNFDFNIKNDCQGNNYCLNNGQYFQDNYHCSTTSIYLCPDCFYSSQCRFLTKVYGFSLDIILDYYIKANIKFSHQSKPVQTRIHESIHRHLIHDEQEHRTWCIVNYQSNSILQ